MNRYAADGNDTEFGRGTTPYQRQWRCIRRS
jgi:hypothetical protein